MSDDQLDRRRSLTFKQAEGLAPVPGQLAGYAVTQRTRIVLHKLLSDLDGANGSRSLEELWTGFFQQYADDLPYYPGDRRKIIKSFLDAAKGEDIHDLIQFLARSQLLNALHYKQLKTLCEDELLPYRLIGDYGRRENPPTLYPVATPEQAEAFERDYNAISRTGAGGVRSHLGQSASMLSSGDFAGSVRESIHAVESAAKSVSGGTNKDLAGALKLIERSKPLHPALRSGLEKIYAWTSDEKGVRHALIDEAAGVTEDEALFMLSACAAFAAWITKQARP